MSKITPCLLFDGNAEEAANFYVTLFSDASIVTVSRYAEDSHFPAGTAIMVEFILFGQRYQALNGPNVRFNEAVSLSLSCADQGEVDRYWDALTADGGKPGPCGWLTDKFGLSWQIVPQKMVDILSGPDKAGTARAMAAMMKMSKLELATLEAAYAGEAA
jgi:predicted 3-demethylubiquinone-9 3-methyltransferase (glyoxalase superfamily)